MIALFFVGESRARRASWAPAAFRGPPPRRAELAETRRIGTRQCHPNEGYGGFDVDVWRYFRKPGSSELVRKEKFHTTYTPSDTVVCTHPRAEDG